MPDLTPEALALELYQAAAAVLGQSPGGSILAWQRLDPQGLTRRRFLAIAQAATDRLAPAHAALAAERDGLRARAERAEDELTELREGMASWPACPDGCGCRLATTDPEAAECACDGPCTMECRENGYPDAPSYRDLAVKRYRAALEAVEASTANAHTLRALAREALEGGRG